MKKIIQLVFFIIFFFNFSNANIVEELTSLNNLYKEGAISKEEFSKAKSILLQTNDKEENIKKVESIKKKKKEKKEEVREKVTNIIDDKSKEDLTKTYISLKEFRELGTYKKIKKYPEGLFKVRGSSEGMAKEAMMNMLEFH